MIYRIIYDSKERKNIVTRFEGAHEEAVRRVCLLVQQGCENVQAIVERR